MIDVAVLLDEGPVLRRPDIVSRLAKATPFPRRRLFFSSTIPTNVRGMAVRCVIDGVLGMLLPHGQSAVVAVDHPARVLGAGLAREVVDVGVAAGLVAIAEQPEHRLVRLPCLRLLRAQRIERPERLVALADPVVVPIGGDLLPVLDAGDRAPVAQHPELVLAGEIVADVAVEDAAAFVRRVGVLREDRNRDRRARALAEDLAAFLARALRPVFVDCPEDSRRGSMRTPPPDRRERRSPHCRRASSRW